MKLTADSGCTGIIVTTGGPSPSIVAAAARAPGFKFLLEDVTGYRYTCVPLSPGRFDSRALIRPRRSFYGAWFERVDGRRRSRVFDCFEDEGSFRRWS